MQTTFAARVRRVVSFLRLRGVPKDLRRDVQRFYEREWASTGGNKFSKSLLHSNFTRSIYWSSDLPEFCFCQATTISRFFAHCLSLSRRVHSWPCTATSLMLCLSCAFAHTTFASGRFSSKAWNRYLK